MNAICTIATISYLDRAIVLGNSCKSLHPESNFYLVLTDATSQEIEIFQEEYEFIFKSVSNFLNSEQEKDFRKRYDVVEFSTSLKPFVLEKLIQFGYETITYLDPDIKLYGRIDLGIQSASEEGIALTPHRISPGLWQNYDDQEILLLKYGTYNLGYISVGKKSINFLKWWKYRTEKRSSRHPADSVYTDQKWIDLAVTYFEMKIIRNLGYNVGPWNIDERYKFIHLEPYFLGEVDLIFFHFSQFDFSRDWINSTIKDEPKWIEKMFSLYAQYSEDVSQVAIDLKKYSLNLRNNFSTQSHLERLTQREFNQSGLTIKVIGRVLISIEKVFRLRRFRWWNYGTYGLLVDASKILKKIGNSL